MNARERIKRIMNFQVPDRIGMFDGYWTETLERWKGEGMPADLDIGSQFGHDLCPAGFDQGLGFAEVTLEEDEQTRVTRDSFGMTQRTWKGAKQGIPHQIDRLIKTRADWQEHKHRLAPSKDRYKYNVAEFTTALEAAGLYRVHWYLEPFELTWRFFGFKETLELMATDPEWASEMFQACADQAIGMHEIAVAQGAGFDGSWAGGDIAYRNGPFFSPRMYRDLLMPHHKRIFSYFNSRGLPTMYHCDGDCRPVLDDLIEAGVRAIQPCEVKAGMDVVALKAKYAGRLVLFGGIDVRALSGTKTDIDREIRTKIPVAMKGGGYIYCVDHSVAPTVSYENYRYALDLIREVGTYAPAIE